MGGQRFIFHMCTFFFGARIAVIFKAWLYLPGVFSKKQNKKFQKKILPHDSRQSNPSKEKFTDGEQSLELLTGFAGAWNARLHDSGDDGVVPVAFANQVNYPVCDLFNGAPVQAVVLSRLEETSKTARFKISWFRF